MSEKKTEIFPENFQIVQEIPVIEVVKGHDNALVEMSEGKLESANTISSRRTGTNTTTSRTSGTSTNSVINIDTLPEELKQKNTTQPLSDRDNDNSNDNDSDWDSVLDNDLTESGELKDIVYSDKLTIDTPFSNERGVIELK